MLIVLIFAGEMIFSLPFHIPRFFRPSMLEVFQITNTQLGDIFAIYGVTAMLAYFPGGAIADYFSPRRLMTAALMSTALGGFYLSTIPGLMGLYLLFAFWGFTTILLFWAAMIKATRELGGTNSQGQAFGFLDGGRGLTASVVASVAVYIFAFSLTGQFDNLAAKQQAMQSVILFYSCVTLLAALAIWRFIPVHSASNQKPVEVVRKDTFEVMRNPSVWLQGGIIIAAYCGYKSLDNYGIYAVQVLHMNALESAELTSLASYTRPIAAIAAGFLADRWSSSKLVTSLFAVCIGAFALLNLLQPEKISSMIVIGNLLLTFIAVYALRAIYFSLIEESKIKSALTGTAVGLISVIGFTPDIFFASIAGRVLDANPGIVGFQHYFIMMAAISALGMLFTYLLSRRIN